MLVIIFQTIKHQDEHKNRSVPTAFIIPKVGLLVFAVLSFLLFVNIESIAQNSYKDIIHTVKKGDNLFRLSKYYETTVKNIVSLNKLKSSAEIFINQELRIRVGKAFFMEEELESNKRKWDQFDFEHYSPDNIYRSEWLNRKSSSNSFVNKSKNGISRGSGNSQTKRTRLSRYSQMSLAEQSSVNYTYSHGFDKDNWTDSESNTVWNTDSETLDIIDRLDEYTGSFQRDQNGRKRRINHLIPTRGIENRRISRGSDIQNGSGFRRAAQAIDNPYYREKVKTLLSGSIHYYRVKKGDSLLSIALGQGSSTQEIIAENELKSPDLRVGRILKIVKRD